MQNTFVKKLVALTLAGCLALSSFSSVAFSEEIGDMTADFPVAEMPAAPVEEPAAEPDAEPTEEPTAEPAEEPTAEPVEEPTAAPAEEPAAAPVEEPTAEPVEEPTDEPAEKPTAAPVEEPTAVPAEEPAAEPTEAPALSEAVQTVQKLIDALPSVDALNEENMAAAYEQTEVAYIAYLALSADEQVQITGAEKFAALFAMFNAQVETLDVTEYSITINVRSGKGTVTAKKTTAQAGESVTIDIAPDTGYYLGFMAINEYASYEVYQFLVAQNEKSTPCQYTFTMPAQNTEVLIDFSRFSSYYFVTTTVQGPGTISAPVGAEEDKQVTLTISPNTNAKLKSLTIDDGWSYKNIDVTSQVQNGKYTFMMKFHDVNVSAVFEEAAANTITIDSGITNGSVSADKKEAAEGNVVTLTINPANDYELDTLTVNGSSTGVTKNADGTYSFTMPDGDVIVSATFRAARVKYSITIPSDIQHGTVAADAAEAAEEETVTLTVTPDDGYELDTLTVQTAGGTPITVTDNSFTMPAEVVTISAAFKLVYYTVTLEQSVQGTLALTTEKTAFAKGETVIFTATPAVGYKYVYGFVMDANTETTIDMPTSSSTGKYAYSFTMPARNVKIEVQYEAATPYEISVAENQHGTVSVDGELTAAHDRQTVTLHVRPADGYELDSLTVNDGQKDIETTKVDDSTYTFTMPDSDVTITATFKLEDGYYTITFAGDAHATLYETPEPTETGEKAKVFLKLNDDYSVAKAWVTDTDGNTLDVEVKIIVLSNRTVLDFTMPDCDVIAHVATKPANCYSVTISNTDPNGTIAIADITDLENVLSDTRLNITSAPKEGYHLTRVECTATVDGSTYTAYEYSSDGSTVSYNMPGGDVTITPVFMENKVHTVTVNAVHGTYTLKKSQFYAGDQVCLGITSICDAEPDHGYHRTDIEADSSYSARTETTGETVSIDTAGTFIMPDDDVIVTITFKLEDGYHTITVADDAKDALSPAWSAAEKGEAVTITANSRVASVTITPESGEAFAANKQADGTYTFTMPDCNVTVSATLVQLYTVIIDDEGRPSSTYLSLPDGENQYAEGEPVTVLVDQTKLGNGTVLENIIVKQLVEGNRQDVSYTVNNTDGSITFTMPANNVEVQAVVEDTYYVTLNTVGGDENCTVLFSGVGVNTAYDGRLWMTTEAPCLTMTITAGDDYKVGSVMVKDAKGTETELTYSSMVGYQYNNITSDVTVTVTFVRVYTVKLVDNEPAILSLPNGNKYAPNETVTINVDETKLPAGKVIGLLGVIGDGETTEMDYTKNAADKTITFTMPEKDVKAYYQLDSGYYISLNTVGAAEGCSAALNNQVAFQTFFGDRYYPKEGTGAVTVNITCAEGYTYTITVAKKDGTPVNVIDVKESKSASFAMPESDVTVTVTFSHVYQVCKNDPFNGTISLSKSKAKEGDEVKVTLTPAACYTLKTLTVDGVDVTAQVVNNVYTFTMPSHAVAVYAEFDVIAYSIQGATGADGKAKAGDTLTVTPYSEEYIMWFIGEPGDYSYAYGQTITVKDEYAGKTITCKIYEDMNHSPNGSGGSHVDYPVATRTVQVEEVEYAVTIAEGYRQYFSLPDGAATQYKAGDTVTINLNIPAGKVLCNAYVYKGSSDDTVAIVKGETSFTFAMPKTDVTVQGNVTDGYYITLNQVGGNDACTVTLGETVAKSDYSDQHYVVAGQPVSCTITPDADYTYTMKAEKSDGAAVKEASDTATGTQTFTMPESNVTITVTFTSVPRSYAITIVCGKNGLAVIDGKAYSGTFTVQVDRLGTLTIEALPYIGCGLLQIKADELDGVTVRGNKITLSGVQCENTITLTFQKLPVFITDAPTAAPTATRAPSAAATPAPTAAGGATLPETVTLPESSAIGNVLYDDFLGTGSGLAQLSITFDGEYQPQDYELLNLKADSETQKNTVLVRACPDENGEVASRSLILSAAQLVRLAQKQQTERLLFENGEAAVQVDLVDLLGGNVQKLIGLLVRGNETVSAETLNRDWSKVQTVALTAAELANVKVEIRIIPAKQADGSMAYDVSVWLRWNNQELDISSMLPSLRVCLLVDDDSTTQHAVGYQAENTEGFLPLNSTLALIPEEMPKNQPDEAEKFIVTMPAEDGDSPATAYDTDASLAQERHSAVTAGYAGKGCYRRMNVE